MTPNQRKVQHITLLGCNLGLQLCALHFMLDKLGADWPYVLVVGILGAIAAYTIARLD